MVKKILKIVLLLFFAITSCKKVGDGDIRGIVTEKGTGIPVKNVEVKLERTTRSGENDKTHPAIIASTVTDENGNYSLPFHMKLKYKYRVYSLPDEHGTYSGAASEYLSDKKQNVNLELPPYAYVKILLHKTSTNTITQSAAFQIDNSYPIYLNVPDYVFDKIQGVYPVKGEDSVLVFWSQSYNNFLYAHESQNFFIAKGDTASYTINLE
jgi:hypothetical protein